MVNAGVDGVIIPDLPLEEEIRDQRSELRELNRIYLIAPTSTDERIKKICDASSGFIYLVSLTGITGKRTAVSNTISGSIAKIRKYTDKPIAVGFGISKPEHAKEVSKLADGVIVGSAVVDRLHKQGIKSAIKFVESLRKATL